ncbi:hypothetical protein [Krasilnikovia sp. MM14-A1259]|uniref:hypothetical protein n=1 Tax=Krasilnikovia sp. MM14-A1259 TaxID=3373539 RepID=UPI00381E2329
MKINTTTLWRRTTIGVCVNVREVLIVMAGMAAPPVLNGQPAAEGCDAGRGTSRRQYPHRMTPASWSTSIPAPQDGQVDDTGADGAGPVIGASAAMCRR